MALHLHTYSPLHNIQEEFAKKFPGLKLDFVFHGDEKLNLSSHLSHTFLYTPINEICPDSSACDIVLAETMTTKEVEELFDKRWHLPAQVYANINGYWQKNNKTANYLLKNFIEVHNY